MPKALSKIIFFISLIAFLSQYTSRDATAAETELCVPEPVAWSIQTPVTQRTDDGGLMISAATNMPNGLKVFVKVMDGKDAYVADLTTVSNGKIFTTFTTYPKPVTLVGAYSVDYTAGFDWWDTENIAVVANETNEKNIVKDYEKVRIKLKGPLFEKTDSDVIDSPMQLHYVANVNIPALPADQFAIYLVKISPVIAAGQVFPLRVSELAEMIYNHAPMKWEAKEHAPGVYDVTLVLPDSKLSSDNPLWAVGITGTQVGYVNYSAKTLSTSSQYSESDAKGRLQKYELEEPFIEKFVRENTKALAANNHKKVNNTVTGSNKPNNPSVVQSIHPQRPVKTLSPSKVVTKEKPAEKISDCGTPYPCRLRAILDDTDWKPVLSALSFAMEGNIKTKVNWSGTENGHAGYILDTDDESRASCRIYELTSFMGTERGKDKVTVCEGTEGSMRIE